MADRRARERGGQAAGGHGEVHDASRVEVVRVREDDWSTYRAVRLAMLLDTPHAFGSTFEREAAFDEAEWRRRLSSSPSWFALRARLPLGSVTLFHAPGQPREEALLVAMWVAAHARGGTAAEGLVRALLDHASETGVRRVVLDVADTNPRAAAFYRRMGFVPTGRRGVLPHDPTVTEFEMERLLGR